MADRSLASRKIAVLVDSQSSSAEIKRYREHVVIDVAPVKLDDYAAVITP